MSHISQRIPGNLQQGFLFLVIEFYKTSFLQSWDYSSLDILANDPYHTCIGEGPRGKDERGEIRKTGQTINKGIEIESQEKTRGKTLEIYFFFMPI